MIVDTITESYSIIKSTCSFNKNKDQTVVAALKHQGSLQMDEVTECYMMVQCKIQ